MLKKKPYVSASLALSGVDLEWLAALCQRQILIKSSTFITVLYPNTDTYCDVVQFVKKTVKNLINCNSDPENHNDTWRKLVVVSLSYSLVCVILVDGSFLASN